MTKKILLGLIVASSITSATFAQSSADKVFKTFRFSLYTGPTFNSLHPVTTTAKEGNDNYSVSKTKGNVGFSLGLQADYNINDRYSVFSGLSLDWRGGSIASLHDSAAISNVNYARSSNITYKLQYLTIPIGLKMKAAQFDKLKIFAQTGIDVSVLLSAKGDYSTLDANNALKHETKVKLSDYAKAVPVNVGWMLGVGAEYDITEKNSVYLTFLYRNGFSDVTTPKLNKDGYKFADGNIRMNTFAIRVGYYF